jgi:protease-4
VLVVSGIGGVALLFAALAGSMGGGGAGGRSHHGAAHLQEVVIEDNDSRNKIAVVTVDGVIAGGATTPDGLTLPDLVRHQLERAADDKHVKAVLLKVDSPGGEVLASDEIYRELWKFGEDHPGTPVVVSMGSLAASGGYYVSAPASWIVANELTMTGSIGVIFHSYNYRGLMDKVGVKPAITKSGKLKDMMSGEKLPEEELPEERQIMQSMINESYARFKEVIRNGRERAAKRHGSAGKPLAAEWEAIADGRILSGREALSKGLVDELGNFHVAVERARNLAGIPDANLVSYDPPMSFGSLFRLLGKAQAESRTVRIDLGLGAGVALPQGRLYFLSPVHVR